jgi:hypothetical protein
VSLRYHGARGVLIVKIMDFSVLECDIKDKKRWLREVGEQLRG